MKNKSMDLFNVKALFHRSKSGITVKGLALKTSFLMKFRCNLHLIDKKLILGAKPTGCNNLNTGNTLKYWKHHWINISNHKYTILDSTVGS